MSEVLFAAERLKRALEQGEDFEDVVTDLESAAKGPSRVSGFRAAAQTVQRAGTDDSEDILKNIALDLHEGNVLVAASIATPTDSRSAPTQESLDQLGTAISNLRDASAAAESTATTHGFRARPAPKVPDLPTAIEQAVPAFVKEGKDTLDGFQQDGEKVLGDAFRRLWNLKNNEEIQSGLEKISEPLAGLQASGALEEQGVGRIRGAVDALRQFLGLPALKEIKSRLHDAWEQYKAGVLAKRLMHWLFGAEEIENRLKRIPLTPVRAKLQKGLEDFYTLRGKFKGQMNWIGWILAGIGAAAGILKWAAIVTGGQILLFTAIAYLTVIAAVVLIGREYTGSQRLLRWVQGVGDVVDDVCVPAE